MSYIRRAQVQGADSPSIDAFSRWRTSHPDTVFDAAFQYNLHPLIFQTVVSSGGSVTHSANDSSASLAVDGTGGADAILQSRQYFRYVPGKSQLVFITGVLGTAVAGVVKRMGYYDANDGIFFEQNGTTDYAWTVRTSTSGSPSDTNRVAKANWNLDTLNGSGPSGVTADFTKAQIIVIDFQWLGYGRVRVGFDIGGSVVYVHEFMWANTSSATTVYMKTANLPVRWEIDGDSAASMLATCCSVSSEGGADRFLGYQLSYNRAVISAGSGTQTYAFSIRAKSTFNSITNRMLIRPLEFFCAVTGANPVLVEVYHSTTMGGAPSWSDMDATYSALQVDTAGTPSGGVRVESFVIGSGAATKGASVKSFGARYPLTMDVAGTGYTNMTVYVTGLGGASNCFPGVVWEEVR